jgi:hypothetical protein
MGKYSEPISIPAIFMFTVCSSEAGRWLLEFLLKELFTTTNPPRPSASLRLRAKKIVRKNFLLLSFERGDGEARGNAGK